MPLETSWYLEPKIIVTKFIGVVTIEEIEQLVLDLFEHFDQTDSMPVHCIHDATELERLPMNVKTLATATAKGWQHPQAGWFVAHDVSSNFTRFIGNVLSQTFKARYRIFDTLPDALSFLSETDNTLEIVDGEIVFRQPVG